MISIGTDIVQISRIKKALETNKDKFLNKIFTEQEIKYCNSYSDPHVHFSGKYAVKESVKKALLSRNICEQISMYDIQVLNRQDKSPYIIIDNLKNIKFNISISHDGDYAIAFVIIEK
tara:strand:- start:49 stop:402 length:354 start_codon:yes stop_codon:yes gene_type:complete